MAFEDTDRRRSLLLGLLTLIALPTIYLLSRDDGATDSDREQTAIETSDGSTPGVDDVTAPEDDGPTRPPVTLSDLEPVFLDGPVADLNPGVNEIAIPARPETPPMQMTASYRSTVAGVRTCLVRGLPSGLSVTVENLDNGRTITCVTSVAPGAQTADVVLHTDTFTLLADPTEAPITVELTQ